MNRDDVKEPGIIYNLADDFEDKNLTVATGLLADVESKRKKYYSRYLRRRKIAAALMTLFTPPLVWLDYMLLTQWRNAGDDSAAGLTIIFAGFLWIWMTGPKRAYAKIYKVRLIPEIMKVFGNFKFDVKGRIDESLFIPSHIMPLYDRYQAEDYFSGTYKNTHIEFSEITLSQRRRNKGRTYYDVVFKGLAIIFHIPHKNFYGQTIIDENRTAVGEWIKEKTGTLKRADLVDPVFEGKFDVYTTDQVEARSLIHPLVIENLVNISLHYAGQKITASFYDGKFMALIKSNQNHFEPADISLPANSPEGLYNLKKEIESILKIGDYLELYQRDKTTI